MSAGLDGIAEFRAALLGVAEAEERCVCRLVGEDIFAPRSSNKSDCDVYTIEGGGGV